jgi:hypothetical protein
MIDLEREQLRRTYSLCRVGFAFLSIALAIACVTYLIELFANFNPHLAFRIIRSTWYQQWIDCPIVWASLIGTTLLWGRWEHTSWQRRTGLLLVMCLVDVALWFFDHGDTFGRGNLEVGHGWFRQNLGQALGWAEFALMASLSGDYLVHVGVEQGSESARAARSMAATGAVIWMILFCEQTDWTKGWPLQPAPRPRFETLLLFHGMVLISTITVLQVTALVYSASRQSTQVLNEMQREDDAHDLLRSRSDAPDERNYFAALHDERD